MIKPELKLGRPNSSKVKIKIVYTENFGLFKAVTKTNPGDFAFSFKTQIINIQDVFFISCESVILCLVKTMLTLSGLFLFRSDAREIVESQPGDPVDEHEATSHHGNSDLGCELAISQLFLVALPFLVLFVIIYQRLGLKCILLVCFLAPVLQLFQALIIKHEIFDLLRSFNVKHKVNEMQLKVQFRNFKCIFNVSQCFTVSVQF